MTATQPEITATPSTLNKITSFLRGLVGQETILLLALLILIFYTGSVNDRFFGTRNLVNMLNANAYIAVAAIGMTLVIITGNIDISVGSLIVVLSILSGHISIFPYPEWVSTDVAILLSWILPVFAGAGVGAIIGFIVTYLRVPAIVVTLGFLSILKGLMIIVTNGERVTGMPEGYALAQMKPLENIAFLPDLVQGLTMPIYLAIIMTIIAAIWMRYSPTGRAIYAVGGNAEAARLSGINEHRIIMTVFILNGAIVGVAAILFGTQMAVIQTTVPSIEMTIITATVVGGVSILGGTGTVIGPLFAAILLSTIAKSLVFLDISPFWTKAIQGVLILVTVLVDLLRRSRNN